MTAYRHDPERCVEFQPGDRVCGETCAVPCSLCGGTGLVYWDERPAPRCDNPDHPAYGDDGDSVICAMTQGEPCSAPWRYYHVSTPYECEECWKRAQP